MSQKAPYTTQVHTVQLGAICLQAIGNEQVVELFSTRLQSASWRLHSQHQQRHVSWQSLAACGVHHKAAAIRLQAVSV
jgi:hypothetical protein